MGEACTPLSPRADGHRLRSSCCCPWRRVIADKEGEEDEAEAEVREALVDRE